MTLIKSISGIRGTIGGVESQGLTPPDIVNLCAAYAERLKMRLPGQSEYKIVVGRDGRISGEMVDAIVCGTLMACGVDVVNAGMASTPTVEMAVIFEKADGGIILTASHNPREWNALKLLNERGEFLDAQEAERLLELAEKKEFTFADIDHIGRMTRKDFTDEHIKAVLEYPLVDVEAIYRAGFSVVLDSVNSVGGIVMPRLFAALGVNCVVINGDPTGQFAHNPEPLPENLKELSERVISEGADMGVAVDPDVDRLALICENGAPFGEEYTLVAVADYILNKRAGNTASNISSTRALRDVTESYDMSYYTSAVGEVNVVAKMKEVGAVIGGEGNGGVIVPDLHYGRDALIGIALFLSSLAEKKISVAALKETFPLYFSSKKKIELADSGLIDIALKKIENLYSNGKIDLTDGVRVDFEESKKWFILRRSNTEPVIRIYAEAGTQTEADTLADEIINRIMNS